MEKLKLIPDERTLNDNDEGPLYVYNSSITLSDGPLVSLKTTGRGIRLTRPQARLLCDWLAKWLAESYER